MPQLLPPSPLRAFISASRSCRARSSSRDCSTRSAAALFCSWDFSFWQETTMPVGRWVIRTAESVVLTLCPPGPEDRNTSIRRSASGMSMWSVCLGHREHLDPRERGLAAALVVERRDPDQPVGALLDRQRAVRVRRLDRKVADLMPASSAYEVS